MKNDNDNKNKKKDENTTKYGEQVPSMYHWLSLEQQKKKAEEMANITKKEKN